MKAVACCALVGLALAYPGTTNATTSAYPTPLAAKLPPGSLIYDPSVAGSITGGNPSDTYTVSLDAAQTLTVLVTPASGLQPSVAVNDPVNNLIATGTATAAGSDMLLQTVPVGTAGTYTITVSGAGGTTGAYTARLTLNAALENEPYTGTSDNTLGTAQDLSASAVTVSVSPAADRLAVLGTIGGAGDVDFYSFALTAGEAATLAVTSQGAGASQVALEDGGGNLLAVGAPAANVTRIISHFVAPSSATYYAVVSGDAGVAYSLVVARGADFDTQPNDTLATAQALASPAVLGALVGVDVADYYSVRANVGDALHFQTSTPAGGPGEFVNGFFPELLLYDANGNLVAIANGNAIDGRNSVIDFTVPNGDAGVWSIEVVPSPSTQSPTQGEYALVAAGATGGVAPPDLLVTKSHSGTFVMGGTATWSITVHNPPPGSSTHGTTTVSDALPAGYTLHSFAGTGWGCSGTTTVTCTSTLVVAGGADFPVLSLTVNVPANSPVSVTNTAIVSGGGERNVDNDTGSDTVDVLPQPPAIAKSFGAAGVQQFQSTSLQFVVTNPNPANTLTGVGFTDTLPGGLVVSTPNGLTGSCGGGTITAVAGSATVTLTGATLAADASCSFSVNVTGISLGLQQNVTGAVVSDQNSPGNTASASLTVAPPIPALGGWGALALIALLGLGAALALRRGSA